MGQPTPARLFRGLSSKQILPEPVMIELHATIPDPDAVLALEPAELAAMLLALIRRHGEAEAFSVHNMIREITYSDRSRGQAT